VTDQHNIQPNDGSQGPQKRRRLPNTGSFQKGRSGNARGRRPGSGKRVSNGTASQILLDKTVTVTLGGKTREISAEEAIQQRTFKDALAGKAMPMREVIKWIIKRDAWFKKNAPVQKPQPGITRYFSGDPDNADEAFVLLGIAAPNPARADVVSGRAQLLLEPWAAQLGLTHKRRGARLSESDRATVRRSTRDPHALIFPGEHPNQFRGEY